MKIQDIMLWILFILSIIIGIWYLFGNSPTFEQAILLFMLTLLFTSIVKTTNMGSRLESLERSFTHLAKDFKQHIKHKQK